jgi:hypothetical protein
MTKAAKRRLPRKQVPKTPRVLTHIKQLEGEERYKLEALQRRIDARRQALLAADAELARLQTEFNTTLNEIVAAHAPDDFTPKEINVLTGTLTFVRKTS